MEKKWRTSWHCQRKIIWNCHLRFINFKTSSQRFFATKFSRIQMLKNIANHQNMRYLRVELGLWQSYFLLMVESNRCDIMKVSKIFSPTFDRFSLKRLRDLSKYPLKSSVFELENVLFKKEKSIVIIIVTTPTTTSTQTNST